jgi:hypothetical protein
VVTTLDMAALTGAQRRVLGLVAINEDGGHHPKVLAALEAKGLIVGHEVTLPGRLPGTIIRWEMPIGVHIQWCEWCAQQADEEDQ